MARCSLCGGRLDFEKRCTLCGLDNTKNDDQYKGFLKQNSCDDGPLTHTHEDMTDSVKKQSTVYPKSEAPTYSQRKSQRIEYARPTYKQQKVSKAATQSKSEKKGAGPIVAIIIAIFGIIPSLIGLIEESSYEPDVREYAYENYLEAGMYEVGVHIPEGTYTIGIDWGEAGFVEIMEPIEKGFCITDSYELSLGKQEYVEEVYLSEGQILTIPSNMLLYLGSDDVDFYDVSGVENYLSESFVITGEATAGIDFPAGVYDIWYEPVGDEQQDDEYGDVSYQLLNPESGGLVFEGSQYFASHMGSTVYRNVYFSEGSKIWLNGLKEVTLTPSEVIGVSE